MYFNRCDFCVKICALNEAVERNQLYRNPVHVFEQTHPQSGGSPPPPPPPVIQGVLQGIFPAIVIATSVNTTAITANAASITPPTTLSLT